MHHGNQSLLTKMQGSAAQDFAPVSVQHASGATTARFAPDTSKDGLLITEP
jgi:hypothetical protein